MYFLLRYRVTVPGRQDSIRVATAQLPAHLSPWERFGLEMILSFLVVFVYFVTMDSHRKWISGAPLSIGSSYIAATIVSVCDFIFRYEYMIKLLHLLIFRRQLLHYCIFNRKQPSFFIIYS